MLQKLLTKIDLKSILIENKFEIIYDLACLGFNNVSLSLKKEMHNIFKTKLKNEENHEACENDISFLWTIIYYNFGDMKIIGRINRRMEAFVLKKYDFRNWKLNSEISEIYALSRSERNQLK